MRQQVLIAVGASLVLWMAVHLVSRDVFIFHDSWHHNFPMAFQSAKQAGCGPLPHWQFGVDHGAPWILNVVSQSLTLPIRIAGIAAMGCLALEPWTAMFLQKIVIFAGYLWIALGMYVLGRVLFVNQASAAYLFVATLFAGFCLDAHHSDQTVAIIFWVPWATAAAALYHRHSDQRDAAKWLNLAILFGVLSLLDQAPHFTALAAGIAILIYGATYRARALEALLRVAPRLWPSILAVAVTLAHLWIMKGVLSDYVPSQRTDLIVDPKTFGHMGFVQPSAIIGTFWPLSFFRIYDQLLERLPFGLFDFKLDVLLFSLGIIPLVLSLIFLVSPGRRAERFGWLAFAAILFLVSLQQSKLYLALFHLPAFNIFRSYFLYIVYVPFAVLVMSGYGLDAMMSMDEQKRRAVLRRASFLVIGFAALAGLVLTILIFRTGTRGELVRAALPYAVLELCLVGVAIWALWTASLKADGRWLAVAAIASVALPQAIAFHAEYSMLGLNARTMFEGYGLQSDDLQSASVRAPTGERYRKECSTFAQCYLSSHDTVSFRTDLEGTFLRNRDEPSMQKELAPEAKKALAGVSYPIFWGSTRALRIESSAELTKELNSHADDIKAQLQQVVYVRMPAPPSGTQAGGGTVKVVRAEVQPDSVRIEYAASGAGFVVAAINYDKSWLARVNGAQAEIFPANFGGLAVGVPPGSGIVLLSYENKRSQFFFWSRYALLLFGLLAMAAIVMHATSDRFRPLHDPGDRS